MTTGARTLAAALLLAAVPVLCRGGDPAPAQSARPAADAASPLEPSGPSAGPADPSGGLEGAADPDLPPPPLQVEEPVEITPVPKQERRGVIIKTILGLVALLALAYLGGHRRVQEWESRLGISQVITAGFPFVALGLIARSPGIGILNDEVLALLAPLLRFGLGWIGFALGFRFNVRLLDELPRGTGTVVSLATSIPFATILFASGLVFYGSALLSGAPFTDPEFLRDALILGTAGAMTAETAASAMARAGGAEESVRAVSRITRLEELAGVAGLALLVSFFRPQPAALPWDLPGTLWLFLSLGLGASMGFLVYAVLRLRAGQAESILLLIGSILFASGMASSLRLSPVVVCFVAGVIVENFPGAYQTRVRDVLERLERPIYLLFLVVVGAIWRPGEWRGWALMLAFVGARLAGKWLGVHLSFKEGHLALEPDERRALVLAPMGALPIAIVVSALLLYPGASIPSLVTAVIGGAIVTEVLVQAVARARLPAAPAPPAGPEAATKP